MLANLSWYHYPILFISIAVIYFIFHRYIFRKYVLRNYLDNLKGNWKSSLVFLFIFPIMIIPIRGGLGTSPINTGAVYFHKDIVVNHAAINPIWNLLYAVTINDKLKFKLDFFDIEKENQLLQTLETSNVEKVDVLNNDRPNIIIIILESFSTHFMKEANGQKSATPNLNKLMTEGLYFENFYSAAASSSRGLGAIISNYPGLPKTCILYHENKTGHLPAISKDLGAVGYTNRYFYGGDIDFAHMKSFLINCKFDEIISDKDFPKSDYYSKWGVPDHKVFNRLLQETNKSEGPFLHVMFTLSSHEPFEVPMETVIHGSSNKEKHMNSVYYTDKSLGEFIEKARKQEWWNNTLLILVADHGARVDDMTYFDKRRFHIPMLWMGGALRSKDTVVSKYGSHTDIAATLLNQMNISHKGYDFSKDLLDKNSKSYAFYCTNGVGFVSDSIYLVFDISSEKFVTETAKAEKQDMDIIKAYLQRIHRDFINR